MNTRVVPYLSARKETGLWERIPGNRLYFEHFKADAPKATIVLVHIIFFQRVFMSGCFSRKSMENPFEARRIRH